MADLGLKHMLKHMIHMNTLANRVKKWTEMVSAFYTVLRNRCWNIVVHMCQQEKYQEVTNTSASMAQVSGTVLCCCSSSSSVEVFV